MEKGGGAESTSYILGYVVDHVPLRSVVEVGRFPIAVGEHNQKRQPEHPAEHLMKVDGLDKGERNQ